MNTFTVFRVEHIQPISEHERIVLHYSGRFPPVQKWFECEVESEDYFWYKRLYTTHLGSVAEYFLNVFNSFEEGTEFEYLSALEVQAYLGCPHLVARPLNLWERQNLRDLLNATVSNPSS